MMIARVLPVSEATEKMAEGRIAVQEMDLITRTFKGTAGLADNAVGAKTGDMVLCSLAGGSVTAVAVVDTIKLIGATVYQRETGRRTPGEAFQEKTSQEETEYGETGAGHGGNQRLGGGN